MKGEAPSHNKDDYQNAEERARGYDQALQNYGGKDLGEFLGKYGHLLDDDDINSR